MQSLYVSYLNMLTSLSNNEQASSYCFRLLSRNERTGNVSLSWDHFFNSLKQYYMSLRSTPDGMGIFSILYFCLNFNLLEKESLSFL